MRFTGLWADHTDRKEQKLRYDLLRLWNQGGGDLKDALQRQ